MKAKHKKLWRCGRMKRKIILFLLLVTLLVLPACGPNKRIVYTKEFTFLPMHTSMELQEFDEPVQGGFGRAVYYVDDFDTFFTEYEEILKKDGWQIAEDNKPDALTVTKGDHTSAMVLSQIEGTNTLIILAR